MCLCVSTVREPYSSGPFIYILYISSSSVIFLTISNSFELELRKERDKPDNIKIDTYTKQHQIAHSLCWIFNGYVTCIYCFSNGRNRFMHIIVVKWIMINHIHTCLKTHSLGIGQKLVIIRFEWYLLTWFRTFFHLSYSWVEFFFFLILNITTHTKWKRNSTQHPIDFRCSTTWKEYRKKDSIWMNVQFIHLTLDLAANTTRCRHERKCRCSLLGCLSDKNTNSISWICIDCKRLKQNEGGWGRESKR